MHWLVISSILLVKISINTGGEISNQSGESAVVLFDQLSTATKKEKRKMILHQLRFWLLCLV